MNGTELEPTKNTKLVALLICLKTVKISNVATFVK